MAERRKDVPTWLVERLAVGELSDAQAARVRSELTTDQEALIKALQDDNRATLEQYPPEQVAVEIRRRLAMSERAASARPEPRRFTVPMLASAAALVLGVTFLPFERHFNGQEPARSQLGGSEAAESSSVASQADEVVRLKGLQPRLAIYKQTSDGATPLRDGSQVSPGDVIQVAYVASGYRYGVVVSVDGNRAVTLHLPETSGAAVLLSPQGETALGHAFELDATSGRERFVFVVSKQPFATDTVIDALRAGETLPPVLVTTELSLRKSTP